MEQLNQALMNIFNAVSWEHVIASSLRICTIFIIAFILLKLIRKFLQNLEERLIVQNKVEGEPPSESQKRIETITRLVRSGLFLALWITVTLVVLKEVGVQIAPIIASAGIVGLAVGFGAQNLVRDMIAGFFMILENQIRVGDVAVLNGTGGLVERMSFRTTVLRDLSGTVHVFPNGTITTIGNLTNQWSAYVFDIGVAYKENTDHVVSVLQEVLDEMLEDRHFCALIVDKPEIFGVDKFGDSAVVIKGRIKTRPIRQWEVGREFLRRVKFAFDERNIEIPFPHRSIYFGDDTHKLMSTALTKVGKSSNDSEDAKPPVADTDDI